jgi:hypothetical protein
MAKDKCVLLLFIQLLRRHPNAEHSIKRFRHKAAFNLQVVLPGSELGGEEKEGVENTRGEMAKQCIHI